MALDAPVGCISLRLQHATASIANCAAWQSVCNASDAAQAAKKIYEESLPPPKHGVKYAPGELDAYRPYVLISCGSIESSRIASGVSFNTTGDVLVKIVTGVPEQFRFDFMTPSRAFNNLVGSIIDQLKAQVDTPGRLAFDAVAMRTGWFRTATAEQRSEGDVQIADLVLSAEGI